MVTKVTDAEFSNELANHDRVIVKYFANWCGNCRLFSPKFVRMSDKPEYSGVRFLDVNAEENPEARKMAGVSNLPFFASFKNGKLVKADATSREDMVEAMVKELIEVSEA